QADDSINALLASRREERASLVRGEKALHPEKAKETSSVHDWFVEQKNERQQQAEEHQRSHPGNLLEEEEKESSMSAASAPEKRRDERRALLRKHLPPLPQDQQEYPTAKREGFSAFPPEDYGEGESKNNKHISGESPLLRRLEERNLLLKKKHVSQKQAAPERPLESAQETGKKRSKGYAPTQPNLHKTKKSHSGHAQLAVLPAKGKDPSYPTRRTEYPEDSLLSLRKMVEKDSTAAVALKNPTPKHIIKTHSR
ncbi:hypothetical protein COY95_00395, partial [Candidatus Woesearchaeota archaeon CG_4_10_14_0_8_um_filter_47_5]